MTLRCGSDETAPFQCPDCICIADAGRISSLCLILCSHRLPRESVSS
jgi:hypothetical protein